MDTDVNECFNLEKREGKTPTEKAHNRLVSSSSQNVHRIRLSSDEANDARSVLSLCNI